jgi:hypothetical protein
MSHNVHDFSRALAVPLNWMLYGSILYAVLR